MQPTQESEDTGTSRETKRGVQLDSYMCLQRSSRPCAVTHALCVLRCGQSTAHASTSSHATHRTHSERHTPEKAKHPRSSNMYTTTNTHCPSQAGQMQIYRASLRCAPSNGTRLTKQATVGKRALHTGPAGGCMHAYDTYIPSVNSWEVQAEYKEHALAPNRVVRHSGWK